MDINYFPSCPDTEPPLELDLDKKIFDHGVKDSDPMGKKIPVANPTKIIPNGRDPRRRP